MKTDTLRKTTGIILFIKSFLLLFITIVSEFIGIALFIESNKVKDKVVEDVENKPDCTGLTAAIFKILGIVAIIVGVVSIVMFIIYFINSKQILYANNFPTFSVVFMLVFELTFSVSSLYILITQIVGSSNILFIAITLIILLQSIITSILLILLLKRKN